MSLSTVSPGEFKMFGANTPNNDLPDGARIKHHSMISYSRREQFLGQNHNQLEDILDVNFGSI